MTNKPEEGPHVPDTVALLEAQAQEIAEKDARIAELEAALKPFADEASMYDEPEDEYAQLAFRTYFLVAHLRAARAALGEKE